MRGEETVRPYELRAQDTKALLQRLYRQLSSLVVEINLARMEASERAGPAFDGLRGLALAMCCGLLAAGAIAACTIAALAIVLPIWLAALAIGVLYGVAALAFGRWAQQRLAAAAEPSTSAIGSFFSSPASKYTVAEFGSRIELERRGIDETIAALEQKSDLLPPLRDSALALGSLGVAVGAIIRNEK